MTERIELLDHHITEPRLRYPGRGGIFVEPTDFEYEFASMDRQVHMASEFAGNRKLLEDIIFTKTDDDFFDNIPSCPCGHLKTGQSRGEICPICHHECLPQTEKDLRSTIWIDALKPVEYFMNPMVYLQLNGLIRGYKGFRVLDWLMDPRYKAEDLDNHYQQVMEILDLPRGMVALHDKFDEIMDTIMEARVDVIVNGKRDRIRLVTAANGVQMRKFLSLYRDRVFTRQLSFPSSVAFILEEHNGRTRGDHNHSKLLNSLFSIVNANDRITGMSIREKESIMARVSISIANHAVQYEHKELFEKQGIFRKLVYGFRSHFTFRTVITSNHGVNKRDELHMPWGVAVMVYKLHLANKLLRRGRTPNQIFSLIYNNTHAYHHLIDKLFQELIDESPGGRGLPTLFTRYPSLKHGSTQRFFIPKIKTDVNDVSTSISPINLVAFVLGALRRNPSTKFLSKRGISYWDNPVLTTT